ncbi:hypothetical protein BDP55DRAFT_734568 [Colletotrichum godetiae]|uniref:Gylcosyl hydrolase 115 C-terminal domain-containing protein n=1 Tax=Colletotrichum godetiae TaxID=1209918 RepID=A0AAJ0ELU5_9PEZI|nr:uncharacterized protein BDP55DRAFT_734568 [Colletotrichum godetiae]KAK1657945.1 hypothetical protein BDP55DRAFT_734568 [Colletotrichum godetiae]
MKVHNCAPWVCLMAGASLIKALLEEPFVAFEASAGSIELQGATLIHDTNDPVGISIAVNSLAGDFAQITGTKPPVYVWTALEGNNQTGAFKAGNSTIKADVAIIAATADSALVRDLVASRKIDVEEISGKWETFRTQVVESPLPGISHALVIVGSDKRGVIFGLYTLSEQSGQSPLHWWADVPTTKHAQVYAINKITTHGEPSVKYRGLFINDEAPALVGWWGQKKNNAGNFTLDSELYQHVFDLLLRLKANFIWPAMWASYIPKPGRIFFTDDPRNQQLADDYGIVVSTSHHEPMQRASNEWKKDPKGDWDWVNNKENVVAFMDEGIRRAGNNESYFTLGMRGTDDGPIDAQDPIEVLEDVFATEREILAKYHGNDTATNQVWTIYKEVATYYAAGLNPPEDVTLMFTDDNWGNIQRLPTEEESERFGGIGVYFHFQYVGKPKSWKSQNTNNFPKVYKELSQAYERGARQIWVMNVGDIKPNELPLSFAMDLAWNKSNFDFADIPSYLTALATRDFGPEHAEEISSALMTHSHLVGMRKFEILQPTTYSILNYREAERVLEAWKQLADKAQALHEAVPEDRRIALFHLLTYPALIGYHYHFIVINSGRNRQCSYERRNSANLVAEQVLQHFDEDFDLTEEYDTMLDGKWKGLLTTPKYDMDLTDWRPSSSDVVANLSYVQQRQAFDWGVGELGIYVENSLSAYRQGRICGSIHPALPTDEGFSPVLPAMEPHGPKYRLIELFHRGDHRKTINWTLEVPHPWVLITATSGILSDDMSEEKIEVSIDWSSVPADFNETVAIRVQWDPAPYFDLIHIPVLNHRAPEDFAGFPETAGLISIEGPHYQRASAESESDASVAFAHIEHLGSRSESGSVALRPFTAARQSREAARTAWVEYDIYIFSNISKAINATVYINGALDTDPDLPMEFSLILADNGNESGGSVNFTRVLGDPATPGDTPPEWNDNVADHVWTKVVQLPNMSPGKHTIRWQVNSPEVYLEKIVLGVNGTIAGSYLGPPETGVGF